MQARSWKSFSPAAASEVPVAPPESQAWKAAGSITVMFPIMPECLVPQYSAQKRW